MLFAYSVNCTICSVQYCRTHCGAFSSCACVYQSYNVTNKSFLAVFIKTLKSYPWIIGCKSPFFCSRIYESARCKESETIKFKYKLFLPWQWCLNNWCQLILCRWGSIEHNVMYDMIYNVWYSTLWYDLIITQCNTSIYSIYTLTTYMYVTI